MFLQEELTLIVIIIKAINRTRIKDIAQRANVSIGTVDRVIHNRGEVSQATKNLILRIIAEMEYQPNLLASTLASKKTFTFAVFIPAPISDESYWSKPMVGVRKAFKEVQQYGVNIDIHLFMQSDPQTFSDGYQSIINSKPDGVVLAPFFSREARLFIAELKRLNIPYVFIDSNIIDSEKLSYIGQDSFMSGTLAARLLDYSIPEVATILIIHFAREMDNLNHLVQREKGFYEYFKRYCPEGKRKLITIEADPANATFSEMIEVAMNQKSKVKGIFVTNSQVYHLARLIEEKQMTGIRIIGHDLISENVEYLKKGTIDFLICQRPEDQGYNSIFTLFDHVILKKQVKADNYTPIDIITRENIDYYK